MATVAEWSFHRRRVLRGRAVGAQEESLRGPTKVMALHKGLTAGKQMVPLPAASPSYTAGRSTRQSVHHNRRGVRHGEDDRQLNLDVTPCNASRCCASRRHRQADTYLTTCCARVCQQVTLRRPRWSRSKTCSTTTACHCVYASAAVSLTLSGTVRRSRPVQARRSGWRQARRRSAVTRATRRLSGAIPRQKLSTSIAQPERMIPPDSSASHC